LGEGWENAKVRGTPYNTGDMIAAALEIGATKGGDWGTCHSVQWDAFTATNESNRELTNRLTRQSYPFGIIVNTERQAVPGRGRRLQELHLRQVRQRNPEAARISRVPDLRRNPPPHAPHRRVRHARHIR
jgi:hypothetical protein